MELKDKLHNLRTRRGYSMDKLAEIAKVSLNTIGQIERGERKNPGITTIEKLSDALNVSPLYFFQDSARTFFDIAEINDAMTDELKQLLIDKKTMPYMILAKRAYDERIPPNIVEELLITITKMRKL